MKNLPWLGTFLFQLAIPCLQSRGAVGDVDPSFVPGSGINGAVNGMVLQPDGKMIIIGEFTTVRGLPRTGIARLNSDGTGDSSFNSSLGLERWSVILLQPDGKVLVGGDKIVRLHPNGTLDSGFSIRLDAPDPGYSGHVLSMALQPDGKVLAAGYFDTEDATNIYYGIARFNPDSSLDTSFKPPVETTLGYALSLQPDGKVIFSGEFLFNGSLESRVVRLNTNGMFDYTFTNQNAPASSLLLQPDGKVLLGGLFTSISGLERRGITRLNADGTVDPTFVPETPDYQSAGSITLQPDGKIVIVGRTWGNFVARLHSDGSVDGTFPQVFGFVSKVVLQTDGRIMALGSSIPMNGIGHTLVRLRSDGTFDQTFDPGTNPFGPFSGIALQPDGKVLLGGPATFISGTNRFAATRHNPDGSRDVAFRGRLLETGQQLFGIDYLVAFDATAPQPDGKVIVAGTATRWECDVEGGCYPVGSNFLARMNADGTRDVTFDTPSGFFYASAVALQPDGKVIVGGSISINSVDHHLVRLNTDGTLDGNFTPLSHAAQVASLALQEDGKILMGGTFSTVLHMSRRGIARLNSDGSLDHTFNPGMGIAGGSVYAMVLQPDGKVLIGGTFTNVSGTARTNLVRLHSNGTLDTTFNAWTDADKPVRAIKLQPDGNVVIGGAFFTVNGVFRPYVARLYGDFAKPALNIARSNGLAVLSWPVAFGTFQLQETTNFSVASAWSASAGKRSTNNHFISVIAPATDSRWFFRLRSEK